MTAKTATINPLTAEALHAFATDQGSVDEYADGHVLCPEPECDRKFAFKTAYANARSGKTVANALKSCSECALVACQACLKKHVASHARAAPAAPRLKNKSKLVKSKLVTARASSSGSPPPASLSKSSASSSSSSASSGLDDLMNSQAAQAMQELEAGPVAAGQSKPPAKVHPRCNRCWTHHKSCGNAAYPEACEACVKANHPCDYDPKNRPVPVPKRDLSPKRTADSKKSSKKTAGKKLRRDGRLKKKESRRVAADSKHDGWIRQVLRELVAASDDDDVLFDGDRACKEAFGSDGCNECECLLSGLGSAPAGHRYMLSAGGAVDRVHFRPDADGQGLFSCRVYYAGKSVVVRLHPQHNARLCDLSPEFLTAKIAATLQWLRNNGQYDGPQPDVEALCNDLKARRHYALKDICVALGLARTAPEAKLGVVTAARLYVDLDDDSDAMQVDNASPW